MSHFAKTENQPLLFFKRSFLKEVGWYSLFPFLLLIAETGLAFFYKSSFLALLAIAAFALPQLYKKIGFFIFLALFGLNFLFPPPFLSNSTWFSLLLHLSFALTAFIVFLIHLEKEKEAFLREERKEEEHRLALKTLEALNEEKSDEAMSLKEEIERLKEEARQRRIEKQELDLLFSRLKKELESFEMGREELIASTLAVKEESLARLREIEEREKALNELNTALPLSQENEVIQSSPDFSNGKSDHISSDWERKAALNEGLYKQLRSQFEEKSQQLTLVRKELFSLEGKWLAEEKMKAIAAYDSALDEKFIHELQTLWREKSALEEEIKVLEELVSRAHQA